MKAGYILRVIKDEFENYGTSDHGFSLTNGLREVYPFLRTASGHLLNKNIRSFDYLDKNSATGYTSSMAFTFDISDTNHALEVRSLSFFRACKLLRCSQRCLLLIGNVICPYPLYYITSAILFILRGH